MSVWSCLAILLSDSAFLQCLSLVCVRLRRERRTDLPEALGSNVFPVPVAKLQIAHFSLDSSNLSCRPALFVCAWAVSKVTCPQGWVGGSWLQRGGEALPVLQAGCSGDKETTSAQL